MEQIRRFLREKGFALALIACLLAAAAAGVWAVRTVRDELKKSLGDTRDPASVAPGVDEGIERTPEEEPVWQQETTEAANSTANIPQPASRVPAAPQDPAHGSSRSSGGASGSGSVREPSALHAGSAAASSSPAAASASPVFGRILNGYSGDELVYNKTLGDWRTHNGIDYAVETGAALSAPVSGKVVTAGTDGNWGPVVEIEDRDYALWYKDITEEPKKYAGKTVRFKALAARNATVSEGFFVAGRQLMTCCAADIEFAALVVKNNCGYEVKTKEWVTIEAQVEVRYNKAYGKTGPVMLAQKVEPAEEPEDPVATFY